MRPEDLRGDYDCDLCDARSPLALALGSRVRNEWLYRLAAEIAPERLSETLSVMAVLSILSLLSQLPAPPYVLGMKVRSPRAKFEVDIAMPLSGGTRPQFVIGEVKSFTDPITAHDVEHLVELQAHLRAKKIDCYILVATLASKLTDEAIHSLRSACEHCPPTMYGAIEPILPIVLTGENLSVHELADNHPGTWGTPGSTLSGLTVESCRRNLGLVDIKYASGESKRQWITVWRGLDE